MMAVRSVTVCDECERVGVGTTHYRITSGGRRRELDLCEEHAAPLRRLIALRARPRTGFESAITTMEELERRKATQPS